MNLEKTIRELTARTPSGGTCWIGDTCFTVWYCADCWEWEFQGVFYFDTQDLSEAIEAHLYRAQAVPPQVIPMSNSAKTWPRPAEPKRITFPSQEGPSGLVSGPLR